MENGVSNLCDLLTPFSLFIKSCIRSTPVSFNDNYYSYPTIFHIRIDCSRFILSLVE